MNRFIRAATLAALVAGGAVGCHHTGGGGGGGGGDKVHDCYDTCWPERYNYAARQAVLAPFAQQVANGHFLEQTVWNWHFETGTDKLNSAGIEKLDSLARSTPSPDPKIFLQAARDVPVTPENVDKIAGIRDELTAKRAAAVMRYMGTQPGNPVPYTIQVHDAPVPGIHSVFAGTAWRGQRSGYVGGISGGSGGSGGAAGFGGGIGSGLGGAGVGAGGGTGGGTGTGTGAGTGTGPGY